jgi:hypothetical protein
LVGADCLGLVQEIRAVTRNRDPETERKDLKRRGKDIGERSKELIQIIIRI